LWFVVFEVRAWRAGVLGGGPVAPPTSLRFGKMSMRDPQWSIAILAQALTSAPEFWSLASSFARLECHGMLHDMVGSVGTPSC
jgi:hypothetical protein